MKYILFFISIFSLSCMTSKKNSYKMVSVYNDTDYHSTFYNFESLKNSNKKVTIYDDSGVYKVGDIIYIIDSHK
jgi:ribosomal protein S17